MNEICLVIISVCAYIWFRNRIKQIKRTQDERLVRVCQDSIRVYIKTGRKNSTFHTLGSALIATAELWRDEYLNYERRRKENAAIDYGFILVCECPRCGAIDAHNMTGNMAGRECKECELTWHVPV